MLVQRRTSSQPSGDVEILEGMCTVEEVRVLTWSLDQLSDFPIHFSGSSIVSLRSYNSYLV